MLEEGMPAKGNIYSSPCFIGNNCCQVANAFMIFLNDIEILYDYVFMFVSASEIYLIIIYFIKKTLKLVKKDYLLLLI